MGSEMCIRDRSKAYRVEVDSFNGDKKYAEHYHTSIYTDGSKTGSNVGSGYVIYIEDVQVDEGSIRLSVHATVFQAEIYAILAAATSIINKPDMRVDRIKFPPKQPS